MIETNGKPVFDTETRSQFAAAYPGVPVKLRHNLGEHPLLTLESLVALGQRLGTENVEYNVGDLPLGVDPDDVQRTGLSIAETIRGIEECGSWMVIKNVDKDPAFKVLLESVLSELKSVIEPVSGPMLTKVGFVFVSSPGAVTPFHLDPEHNILLQIRGSKTMMIVPGDESVVPSEKHESYHLGGHRNVPWCDDLATRGHSFDLVPGDALHVPLMWPHWVKNGPEPSISFSITWRSEWVYQQADAFALNGTLRRIGINPSPPLPFPMRNTSKAMAWRAIRKAQSVFGVSR